jgi:hypothetical protein
LVVIIAIGLPAATWQLTRHLKPLRQAIGGPGPRFDRVDHWLYDRYRFGVADRSRVLNAVLGGQELHEQPLRQAAHSLAAAMLAGKAGLLYRWGGWIRICSGLALIITGSLMAVVLHNHAITVIVLAGLPQLVWGALYQRTIRRRVEQAHRVNG